MSGHSKWSTIKRAKAATDDKRGRLWSKLARRIMMAAKDGGGDPDMNLSLRYAIDDAKAANMPKDNIAKAIKKGTGELGGQNYEQIVYEGYGPGGVAFIVDCLTDNRNRTAPELRKIFERGNGQLGSTNCVAWMFESKGTFLIASEATDEDALMEIVLDAGADDVITDDNGFEVSCEVAAFSPVKQALADNEIVTLSAEIAMVPSTTISVDDASLARKLLTLMDAFEDHDDVQKVFANFDIPEDILAEAQES
ncbi:MAG: YebC/PmpR family DNA-binding transcriptional regulator [Phycisphaerae bacterium]|nr:YebC/PmpR family DNA-binding transcriptional regulator [Planctomycetota bacterium]MBL7219898.1 YebC/PmpR family DNA-binding transcriptional regulator [Phycisphaerae bacterium]